MVINTMIFNNQATYAVLNNATDRAACQKTFFKKPGYNLKLTAGVETFHLTSGGGQMINMGLRINGVDFDVNQCFTAAAPSNIALTASRLITTLTSLSGSWLVEPVFHATAVSQFQFIATWDLLTFSVEQVPA
jgi:hypothetical protein